MDFVHSMNTPIPLVIGFGLIAVGLFVGLPARFRVITWLSVGAISTIAMGLYTANHFDLNRDQLVWQRLLAITLFMGIATVMGSFVVYSKKLPWGYWTVVLVCLLVVSIVPCFAFGQGDLVLALASKPTVLKFIQAPLDLLVVLCSMILFLALLGGLSNS